MTSYTLLWTNETWEKYSEIKRNSSSCYIDYVAGDNKRPLSEVKPGDEIFVVTVKRGSLYVAGRLLATTLPLSRKEAIKNLGRSDLISKDLFLVANKEERDEFRPGCLVDLDIAKSLQLIKVDGSTALPALNREGFIDRQAFRSPFKLTRKSAETLRSILSKSTVSLRSKITTDLVTNEPKRDDEANNSLPVNAVDGITEDSNRLARDTESLSPSEREAVVKVRFGQGLFRSSLIKIAGDACWMSGIEGKELLIASHIQPWAHCEKNLDARRCPDNGLLLSSLWDAAFDSGLVSFDEEWRVIMSSTLSESAKKHLGLHEERFLPKEFRNFKRAQYLTYHRAVIFRQ